MTWSTWHIMLTSLILATHTQHSNRREIHKQHLPVRLKAALGRKNREKTRTSIAKKHKHKSVIEIVNVISMLTKFIGVTKMFFIAISYFMFVVYALIFSFLWFFYMKISFIFVNFAFHDVRRNFSKTLFLLLWSLTW